mgnify:FL=1
MAFAYAAAYLAHGSNKLFEDLGVEKGKLHMTTCFDTTATLKPSDNIDIVYKSAVISKITELLTPSGLYVIAELSDCDWSKVLNAHFNALGAVEDLPHFPHLTLLKSSSPDLVEKLQSLVGKKVYFDSHVVKVKGL